MLLGETATPCLSIVVPTYRTSPARTQNPEAVRKAVHKAKLLLQRTPMPKGTREKMAEEIVEWSKSIDHVHSLDGLGLYISPTVEESVTFPFPVTEKIIIDKSFETRDLYYLKQYMELYYVMVLSKDGVKLLEAHADTVKEVRDGTFPMVFEQEYEYERSAVGSSYGYGMKAFEKDKGELTSIRIRDGLRAADEALASILKDSQAYFVVSGTKELVADFEAVTSLKDRIAGRVTGSYTWYAYDGLRELAWETYSEFYSKKLHALINRLRETPPQMRSEGLREVYKAAVEGKGLYLLVEKDFRKRAYLKDEENRLYLNKPGEDAVPMPDAVDEIIEMVTSKNGKIVFAENGELTDFGQIALIHRY